MDEALVERWIEGYLKAWRTNDPEDIGRSSPRRPVLHGATPGAVAGASGHHRRVDRTEGRAGPVGLPSRDRGSGRRCGLRPGLDRLSGRPADGVQQPLGHPVGPGRPMLRVHRVVDGRPGRLSIAARGGRGARRPPIGAPRLPPVTARPRPGPRRCSPSPGAGRWARSSPGSPSAGPGPTASPSTCATSPRCPTWGSRTASDTSLTGPRQASRWASRSTHSSRVRVAKMAWRLAASASCSPGGAKWRSTRLGDLECLAQRLPEPGLQRADGQVLAVRGPVHAVAGQAAGERHPPRGGTWPVARNQLITTPSQDVTTSSMDTSRSRPRPVLAASTRAATVPRAAAIPPPKSPTWTAGSTGGPSGAPVAWRSPA